MLTECARCGKAIDTVQGYKFGPNQYLCMPCYDQFKAERVAKAKKEHVNPLVEKFGKEPAKPTEPPAPVQHQKTQPAPQIFQPKAQPKPAAQPQAAQPQAAQPPQETAAKPAPAPGPEKTAPAPPQKPAEICDVCRRPLSGFKFPLKDGKKACLDCNNLLRDVAKSLILNIQCPHCGKEIQLSQG